MKGNPVPEDKLPASQVPDMLDRFGKIVDGIGSTIGGPVGIAGRIVQAILSASARAIRARGETVDEIIKRIEAPERLDMSFRSEIDDLIDKKPG